MLSQSLTESQWAIMRSKLSVDIVKFLSLASPMCLFLDCVLAVGRSVRADSEQEQQSNLIAVDCLQSYQSIGVLPSSLSSSLSLLCGEGTPLFFASDLLTQLVVMEVVSSASYTKVLVSTLKPKHTAAFESCRSLKGLQIGCHKAVLFAVGRYLQGLGLGLDLSRDGSSCWFWDLSVMSHLKSSLQDELFDFITDQIKRITS